MSRRGRSWYVGRVGLRHGTLWCVKLRYVAAVGSGCVTERCGTVSRVQAVPVRYGQARSVKAVTVSQGALSRVEAVPFGLGWARSVKAVPFRLGKVCSGLVRCVEAVTVWSGDVG